MLVKPSLTICTTVSLLIMKIVELLCRYEISKHDGGYPHDWKVILQGTGHYCYANNFCVRYSAILHAHDNSESVGINASDVISDALGWTLYLFARFKFARYHLRLCAKVGARE